MSAIRGVELNNCIAYIVIYNCTWYCSGRWLNCRRAASLSIELGNIVETVARPFPEGQVRDSDVIKARYEHNGAEDKQWPQTVKVLLMHQSGGDEGATDQGYL